MLLFCAEASSFNLLLELTLAASEESSLTGTFASSEEQEININRDENIKSLFFSIIYYKQILID